MPRLRTELANFIYTVEMFHARQLRANYVQIIMTLINDTLKY